MSFSGCVYNPIKDVIIPPVWPNMCCNLKPHTTTWIGCKCNIENKVYLIKLQKHFSTLFIYCFQTDIFISKYNVFWYFIIQEYKNVCFLIAGCKYAENWWDCFNYFNPFSQYRFLNKRLSFYFVQFFVFFFYFRKKNKNIIILIAIWILYISFYKMNRIYWTVAQTTTVIGFNLN